MNVLTSPGAFTLIAAVAAYLMIRAGTVKKQLGFKTPTCPVCGHPRNRCTCRWR
jgi:hypothetical protein